MQRYTPYPTPFTAVQNGYPVSVDSKASSQVSYGVEESTSYSKECRERSLWRASGRPWISLQRSGTILGLAALVFSFLQIFVSFAILQASNGTPVKDWTFQPNVYLAILTAISNEALTFAAVQGTVISWWLRTRQGATLAQLYRDYYQGITIRGALSSGRHFNALALACLCATFVNIDGPLLQRASTVRSRLSTESVPLAVSIAPEIPSYFTGWTIIQGNVGWNPQSEFLPVMRAFERNEAIVTGIAGCDGICSATVHAPALVIDHCETETTFINYTAPLSKKALEIAETAKVAPSDRTVFTVGFQSMSGVREGIKMMIGLSDDGVTKNCAGDLVTHTCELVSAVAEYPITITHNKITFENSIAYPKLVALANNTALTNHSISHFHLGKGGAGSVKTTLGGIGSLADYMYFTAVGLIPSPVPNDTPNAAGSGASWLAFQHQTNWERWNDLQDCAPAFDNPRDLVMENLNSMMFRTGVYVAQNCNETWLKERLDDGLESYYNVSGMPLSPINFFEVDFRYFFGAAVVEAFAVVAILYTFYGFWRLERTPTFNPLEVGKAFDAPLLRAAGQADCAHRIARTMGDTSVQ